MLQSDSVRIRLLCLIVMIVAHAGWFHGSASAQGRLSQVRENIRGSSDEGNDSQFGTDNDDDHESRPRRRPPRRYNDWHDHGDYFGPSPGLGWSRPYYYPPHVSETVYVYEPYPVYTDSTTTFPETWPSTQQPMEEIGGPRNDEEYGFDNPPSLPSDYVPEVRNWFDSWNGRVTGQFGSDFDAVTHGGIGLLIQPPGSFGIDTSVTMFRESTTTFREHLWLGDVNLVHEFTEGDLRARLGAGINWSSTRSGGNGGFNLTCGLDWQLNHNWVLTGEIDFGSLGKSDLFHGKLSLGRQLGRAEIALGYDYFDIGGAPIGGLFTAVRKRF